MVLSFGSSNPRTNVDPKKQQKSQKKEKNQQLKEQKQQLQNQQEAS